MRGRLRDIFACVGAGSAAADHYVTGNNDVCVAGGLTTGTGIDIGTDDAWLKVHKSDAANLTCRFAIPAYVSPPEHMLGVEWFRPRKATLNVWWLLEQSEGPPVTTGGVLAILPNGTGVLRCAFGPPQPPEA